MAMRSRTGAPSSGVVFALAAGCRLVANRSRLLTGIPKP